LEFSDLQKPEYREAFKKWQDLFNHDLSKAGHSIARFNWLDLELIFVTVMKSRDDAAYDAKLEENEACARVCDNYESAALNNHIWDACREGIAEDIRERAVNDFEDKP
jgi:hypothetical protein